MAADHGKEGRKSSSRCLWLGATAGAVVLAVGLTLIIVGAGEPPAPQPSPVTGPVTPVTETVLAPAIEPKKQGRQSQDREPRVGRSADRPQKGREGRSQAGSRQHRQDRPREGGKTRRGPKKSTSPPRRIMEGIG